MPGHKGVGELGVEWLDITEVDGADCLSDGSGIIGKSERAASSLFGSKTLYSTEGSSLAIRAMVLLVSLYAKSVGKAPRVLAARNCHRSFLSAIALTDVEVQWLTPDPIDPYLSSSHTRDTFAGYLDLTPRDELPTALYLTSPDYLGNTEDIEAIAELCHSVGMLLIVDNAHGAYLKFLEKSRHPIDLGADMCADSAHKTLPALTGAAYLHIADGAPELFHREAKRAMATFASTSPSYLTMASLDLLNKRLDEDFPDKLRDFVISVHNCKQALSNNGFTVVGDEPMKITIYAKSYGYTGYELADALRAENIECEFCDCDFITLMPSPESEFDLYCLSSCLMKLKCREERAFDLIEVPPDVTVPKFRMSVKEAMLSPAEDIDASRSLGRVVCDTALSCPPAVPIIMPGEVIDEHVIFAFSYYGIKTVRVVQE